ncbi:MAG: VanZ family protein [Steroidobacter sp.]
MLPLRYPRLWLGFGWAAVVFAIVICLMPVSQLPQVDASDKTEHFLAYLLLSLWFAGIYPKARYWIIAIGLCILGVLIEFAQGTMHLGRHADPMDVVANSTGIVAGLLVCWFGLGGWAQWIESLVTKAVVRKS